VNRWQRYWFDEGGRYALAMVRIAIAVSVLIVLVDLAFAPRLVAPAAIYRPVGIWMLFGASPPPGAVVSALWVIAFASTIAMLFGATARIATAVSFVSALAIISLSHSGTATWSHGHNVVLLAHLAMLGSRNGDAIAIDALRRPMNVECAYQWSLRLIQFAVALMFIGACYHKLRAGGFSLAWATSDNLRHQLLVRYDLVGAARPAIVDWLLDDVWRYRTAAIMNLLSQAAPLAAIIFVRRAWLRAAVAVVFVVECVAIDLVLGLPNPHWLPLAAVFVDWDRLFARFRQRVPQTPWRPRHRHRAFVVVFVLYDVVISFVSRLDHRLNTYPFSSFQMFAIVRSAPPWDEHRPYVMYGDHYAIDRPMHPAIAQYFNHVYRFAYQQTDPAKLEPRLATILAEIRTNHAAYGATFLRHHLAMFVAPAYPAKARLDKHIVAITGELGPTGFRTVLGTATRGAIELHPRYVDTAGARLVYYTAHDVEPVELVATRAANTFTLASPLPATAEHVVAVIGETRWLVWSRHRR
jgi:hypothetical protein